MLTARSPDATRILLVFLSSFVVSRLRRKLDSAVIDVRIETISRFGYQLTPDESGRRRSISGNRLWEPVTCAPSRASCVMEKLTRHAFRGCAGRLNAERVACYDRALRSVIVNARPAAIVCEQRGRTSVPPSFHLRC
ncbi:helix-turn-helix domain-containing protein [Paraburkholderia sp. J41]|uniref:helix-turn-helix domain-containing protein n=1 Tax=Paraburkholderia sp. J41 TaxID=2805433 RepID=UPI002AC36C56|nr:helix-turn-helix domain-containing protein [Paraburkholderia sp. J41]